MTGWAFAGALLLSASAYLLLSGFLGAFRKYRGERIITCPETHEPEAVRVDALRAAHWAAVAGEPALRLSTCSRWPERSGCDQACLSQIEASPETCRVRTIVSSWYEGKDCVYCRKPIGEIAWHEQPPALSGPDKTSREWKDVRTEDLPAVLRTHEPVCWKCYVTEEFRHDHPELVVERMRPEEPQEMLEPTATTY